MLALSARMFVWKVISSITLMIVEICWLDSLQQDNQKFEGTASQLQQKPTDRCLKAAMAGDISKAIAISEQRRRRKAEAFQFFSYLGITSAAIAAWIGDRQELQLMARGPFAGRQAP